MQKCDTGFIICWFGVIKTAMGPVCHTQNTFTIQSVDELFLYFYSHLGIKEICTTHFALTKMFYLEQAHAKSFTWNQKQVGVKPKKYWSFKLSGIRYFYMFYFRSMNPGESRSSGPHSLRPLLSQIIILPPPARRSAGHHVAMLEMLKADLVGADCCLIVLLRAAERWGLQQGFMWSGATAVDAPPMESNLAGFHWCAEAKVNRVMHL